MPLAHGCAGAARGRNVGMKKIRWQVLPHEWAFNAFLLFTFLRLLIAGPLASATWAFLAFVLVGVGLIEWTQRNPTPLRWRVRLLWYPSVMGLSFYAIPAAVKLLVLPSADGLLAHWDESFLGMPAADYFLILQGPLLTDIMSAGYLVFFVYLIIGPGYWCLFDMRLFRACFAGMFVTYALGFLGYTYLPAGGPYQAVPFAGDLPWGPLSGWVLPFINKASNGVDVFPSIHVGVSFYLLLFDRRHYRARFEVMLIPCILLWLSTVYLRYHYVVDLLAGVLIALIGLGVSWLYQRSALSRAVEQQALVAKLKR